MWVPTYFASDCLFIIFYWWLMKMSLYFCPCNFWLMAHSCAFRAQGKWNEDKCVRKMCRDISQWPWWKRLNFQNCCWQIEIDQIQNPTHVCHILEAFWDWSVVRVNTKKMGLTHLNLFDINFLSKPDDLAQFWRELYWELFFWSSKMQ